MDKKAWAAYMRVWRKKHPGYAAPYVKAWTKKWRARLLKLLGGKCVVCRTRKDLTFDHIYGRDYDLTKLSQSGRLVKLKREIVKGEIQILCRFHNSKKQ